MTRMRELRLQHGLTAKQMANQLHLSESSVTLYETGKREPTPGTLSKIADILGTTVDDLIGRAPQQQQKPAAESHELTETERELIRLLGQIPEDRKEEVLGYIEAYLRLQGALKR